MASIPVARILGRVVFGEFAVVQGTVGMFAAFASLGLGVATTKAVAECRKQSMDQVASVTAAALILSLFSGAAAGTTLFASSGYLAEHTLAAPHLSGAIRIGCGLLMLGAIEGVLIGTLAGLEDFRSITLIGLAKGGLAFPCLVAGAYFEGLNGVLWGTVASGFTGVVFGTFILKTKLTVSVPAFELPRCVSEWKLLLSSAIPVCVSTIIVAAAEWLALAIIANEASGYGELGVFTAVHRAFSIVLLVATLINKPLMPIIAQQLGGGLVGEAMGTVRIGMKLTALAVLPLVAAGAVGSSLFMSLFGPDFESEWPTLVIAIGTAGVAALLGPLGRWLIASNRAWTNALFFGVWAVVMVSLTQLLADWGAFGLVVSRGVAYVLRAALMAGAISVQFVRSKKL